MPILVLRIILTVFHLMFLGAWEASEKKLIFTPKSFPRLAAGTTAQESFW